MHAFRWLTRNVAVHKHSFPFSTTFCRLAWKPPKLNSPMVSAMFLPPVNRDMKVLDRSFFKKTIPTSAATIFDPKEIQNVKNQLMQSREILNLTGPKPVRNDEIVPGAKCLILDPCVKATDAETWSTPLSQLVKDEVVQVRPYELNLTYDDWTMNNILEAVLPELPEDEKETPAGFAQVGHVAHLNLKEKYLPYKYLIGEVLLDKNSLVNTVINKTLDVGSESVFRTFPYEIIAGEDNLDVVVHHANCEFRFNFGEVYWNTRLGTEHERLCATFKAGEAICDVMAGVGPFAIPAAKKGVWVHANDLNPACFQALFTATINNKVIGYVKTSCMDGRHFIHEATANLAKSQRSLEKEPKMRIPRDLPAEEKQLLEEKKRMMTQIVHEPNCFDHYVMNLPGSAVEFLDAFEGVLQGRENEFVPHTHRKLPFIHVYTFQARHEDEQQEREEVLQKVSKYLGATIAAEDPDAEVNLHDARLVSPNKKYYCASFRLPASVAFSVP